MESEFERALQVLQRYISPVNARSVLLRTLQQHGLSRETLRSDDLRKCADNLRRAVSLFVDSGQQEWAFRDLRELCGTTSNGMDVSILEIKAESDVGKARAEARRICDALGTSPFVMQKVATIVSELSRNMVLYADGGLLEVGPNGAVNTRLVVQATDHGPGIPNLPEIMSGRYRSKTGLGRGLLGTKRLADRFDISTGNSGTRIVAEVAL